MDAYREFWNKVLYGPGADGFGPSSIDNFWIGLGVFVALCLLIAAASERYQYLPVVSSLLIFGIYLVAFGPFAVWTLSCPSCGGSSGIPRSTELPYLQMFWGGYLGTGVAVLWLAVFGLRGVLWLQERTQPSRQAE